LEKEKTTTALSDVEKTLIPYFSSQDWIIDWKSNAELFLQQINIFAEQWNENTEKLEHEIQQHSILSATLSEMEIQLKSLSEDAGKKENVLFGFENNYQELTQQRKSIFEGEHVQHVEARLKQSIETAKEILNINKIKQQELDIANTKATTQKEQLEKDIVVLNKNIGTYSGLIQQWLDEYNVQSTNPLDYEKLVILLSSANDWIDTERVVLKDIDDDVMKALTVLNERIQLLEQHEQKRLSDKPLDEVNELHGSAKFGLETASRSKNEISFRLQQDEENKKKIGDLLKTIETRACIAETWSKLNEIIGSADGKKFRQIAQEYTLDVLLGYANIHLEVLTSRYKIQRIPSSLGLQVVDQDMGDEVRTVYSLSGGESFLVSLALALGLASLSSSLMKVESLFIDEGFGSLDPTTLNIAMDALERLHNQGRKVGVISHVQEMTERIPTQIKVSKMANGKSKVEVLGI
jgi:exonuclease SbcC